ncbi:MAG: recombination factor protein RarA [Legionella sp.]|nr:MAG: recombination factor protein RarA [Legionella sp.]PJD98764.1 MAG: recombination factor protein RarA [Legionella sp.]
MSLFLNENQPLAELLRPKHLNEVVGQTHLLGENKPLRLSYMAKKPYSMIFWGPPGVGKTTLARLIADAFDGKWIALSAVFSGVKDIRKAVEEAIEHRKLGFHTVLFIDEIHRFNKAQQDALLPYTESGLITFIGATTENPSFEVNSALLSRAQVYVLNPLKEDELLQLVDKACKNVLTTFHITDEARAIVVSYADGDARRLFNLLEQLQSAAIASQLSEIDKEKAYQILVPGKKRFDKQSDGFYDHISALHKSVRGSNPDAALYWLCNMLEGGVDPLYLARRIIRMAWEDIGLADPRAMQIANDAAATYERLGSPEGELALAQAVIYLSVAAKSNAGYVAYNKAKAFVKKDKSREIPLHLRNAPTPLMKQLGHGKQYRYAHDEPYGYAAGEVYFPDGIEPPNWYQPVSRGLESKIVEKMALLKKLDQQVRDQLVD